MIKAVDQQLFNGIYKALANEFDVHVVLPDEDEPYPFVVIGEIQVLPKHTFSGMLAKFSVTLDIWGSVNQRGLVSRMSERSLELLNYLKLESFSVSLNPNETNFRILRDDSTQAVLWHGVLQLEFFMRV